MELGTEVMVVVNLIEVNDQLSFNAMKIASRRGCGSSSRYGARGGGESSGEVPEVEADKDLDVDNGRETEPGDKDGMRQMHLV